jgi:hypothetical protein
MCGSGNDGIGVVTIHRLSTKFEIKPVAEKKVQQLPPGSLFWRIDNFPTLAQARAVTGPTGLAAEVAGKVWLFGRDLTAERLTEWARLSGSTI